MKGNFALYITVRGKRSIFLLSVSALFSRAASVVVDHTLDRQFTVDAPDRAWVTDITYLRRHEGFAYLCVAVDLFSRRVVGWAIQSRQTSELAVQALQMAIWRRKPGSGLLIHSDQWVQFTNREWAAFLPELKFEHSMSRRGIATTMRWLRASFSY